MKKYFLFALLLIPVASNSTSIIIYILNNQRLFAAADSLQSYIIKGKIVKGKTICKIHNMGNYYFAIAGHADEYVLKEVLKSFNMGKTYDKSISMLKSNINTLFQYLLPIEKNRNIESYSYFLNHGLTTIAVFYFNGKVPAIDVYDFKLLENKNGTFQVKCEPHLKEMFAQLGMNDHQMPEKDMEKLISLRNVNPEKVGETFVRWEMKFHGESIGEPIDVMELTPTGLKYFTPKRNCQ